MNDNPDRLLKKCSWLSLALAIACPIPSAFALNYFGRIISGGYFSAESYTDASDGMPSNNFSSFSNRFYLKATDIGKNSLDATVDLRDKNDFFDKLDAVNLRLTPVNKFQAYQFNVHLPNFNGYYGTAGRFSLSEAGGVFVDGAEGGYRWTPAWRSSVFAGLDPKRTDQTYVGFNSDSDVFGTYTLYQPQLASWMRNTYWANAMVGETVSGHLDRFFWYNNVIYSWDTPNQVVALVYLDFVPQIRIQTGLFSYHQEMPDHWSTTLNATAIDVIEYQRRQGLLETLPSSPYREGAANLRREFDGKIFLDTNVTYGVREMDSLSRAEISAGPSFYQLINQYLTGKALFGGGRNFSSHDAFTRIGTSYFSKNWEFDLNLNYTLSRNDSGNTYHQWFNEFSIARYFSHDLFANVAIQQGQDERLNIWSGFLKISYLFGKKKDVAPVRDSAPPPFPPPPPGRIN